MLHRKTTIRASFESLFSKIVEKKERKGGKKRKKKKRKKKRLFIPRMPLVDLYRSLNIAPVEKLIKICLLYTSDAADE